VWKMGVDNEGEASWSIDLVPFSPFKIQEPISSEPPSGLLA
jgi:hypothetical protein